MSNELLSRREYAKQAATYFLSSDSALFKKKKEGGETFVIVYLLTAVYALEI